MTSARKLTPVPVIYFPKRGKRPSRVTQTIPEIAGPIDEPVTEVDVQAPIETSRPKGKRSKRSRTSSSHPKITLSDEKPEDVARGFSDLAALGHELFTAGRVQEARAVYEGLIVSQPDDAFAHTMLGTISLALDDLDRALELFERALRIDPDDLAALVYRGEIRLTKKRTQKAVEDLEHAIRVGDPNDPFTERAHRLLRMARKTRRS